MKEIKKYMKIGFKLSLVEVIPGLISGVVLLIFGFNPEAMASKEYIALILASLVNLYSIGYFVTKWKQWIFR